MNCLKNKKIICSLFFISGLSIARERPTKVNVQITFEQSMRTLQTRYNKLPSKDQKKWQIFSKLYKTHAPALMPISDVPLIPLKIHQIWIGSEVPEELLENCQRIRELHPEWEYKLWVDADLQAFHLINRVAFDNALNYGEKADILRYEILERFGGVYMDMDIYCVRPLDILHYCYDFYAGISNVNAVELNNALIGCAPGHPIIQACIKNISIKRPKHPFAGTIERTGPVYFTGIFLDYIQKTKHHKVVALPVSFFYPLPNSFHGPQTKTVLNHWIQPETFTVHFWECRWMKPKGFVYRKKHD